MRKWSQVLTFRPLNVPSYQHFSNFNTVTITWENLMTMQTLIQRAEGGRRQRGIHPICPQPSHWNLSPTCLETPLAKISPKINKMARARGACHFHLPHKVIEGCFRRATAQRGPSDAEKMTHGQFPKK